MSNLQLEHALFGPAGNPEEFYRQGYKSSLEIPGWLSELGLDVYEYQCGRGVNVSVEWAEKLKNLAEKSNVLLTMHAPYYISLSNPDKQKRLNNLNYMMKTLKIARHMGAKRIVVHPGSCVGMSRVNALDNVKANLLECVHMADEGGFGDISICPETMGKINQLGTLEEILELCLLDDRLVPTIDFGHLHARSLGGLTTEADIEHIFDVMEDKMGEYRTRTFHAHYSRIEFTRGGEKKHHTLNDDMFGPDFEPIVKILTKRGMTPIVVCESRGTQAEDAARLKKSYQDFSYCK